MRFHYDKLKDCQTFWSWVNWEWRSSENGKEHNCWRLFGLSWDTDEAYEDEKQAKKDNKPIK